MSAVTVHKITGYDDAMTVLTHPDLVQALYDEGAAVMQDALITLHGAAHAARRSVEFAVFGRRFFRLYQRELFPALLAPVLAPYLAQGEADLVELGYRVTMNLTADLAGIDRPLGTVQETEQLLLLVKTFSTGATLAHSTLDHETVNRQVKDALAVLDAEFLLPSIQRRTDLLSAGRELPNDVLSKLLADANLELPPSVLLREMAFYLQAGAHSTANATVHALHNIYAWIASGNCQRAALVADPVLVQRCVHESFRLHPASPVALRRAAKRLLIGDLSVGSGDLVQVDLVAANRELERFGEDAAQFNPRRALAPGVWPFGLSFGYGNHACLGRDLDGGVVPKPNADPDALQLGIVPSLVLELLRQGATPIAARPPLQDGNTLRANFGSYPVAFDSEQAA